MLRARVVAVAALAGGLLGCAPAQNYLQPDAPRYEGNGAPARATPADSLRVVTFNIQFARRTREATAALESRAELRGADLLLLQEMDGRGVAEVAQALRLNYAYFPAARHPRTGRDFGNAVLTPWPIERSWKLLLPHHGRLSGLARAAVAARVRIGERTVQAYSVHLATPFELGPAARRDQVRALLRDASTTSDPVVIGGDTNSHGLGAAFAAFGFEWPTRRVGGTLGGLALDHVFTRGLSPVGVGVARDVEASDHRPVWAVLDTGYFVPPPTPSRAAEPAGGLLAATAAR